MKGERPPRPQFDCVSDTVWDLMQKCWEQEAENRPDCDEVAIVHSFAGMLPQQEDFHPSEERAAAGSDM